MGDIISLIGSYPSGTDALTPVKLIVFSYDETINIQNRLLIGDYVYLPGTANDRVTLTNGSSSRTFTFNSNGDANVVLGTYQPVGNRRLKVESIGGVLFSVSNAPSYAVSESSTTVNEGDTVTFTITTTDVQNGTVLYWTTVGSMSANDFADDTNLGAFTVNNNTATITRTIKNDFSPSGIEGTENFQIQIREGNTNGTIVATSSSISVADTSFTSYTVTGASNVIEDDTATYTVTTVGVTDGTALYYSVQGSPSSDVTPVSGSFFISNDTGSFTIKAIQDLVVDTGESFTVDIRTNSTSGPIVGTVTTTIEDKPFTVSIVPTSTTVNESSANSTSYASLDITTSGISDGTVLYLEVTGASSDDFELLPGSTTVSNDSASVNLSIRRDGRTEGSEVFAVRVKNAYGNVLATSPDITIVDTSYIGMSHVGKAFGPIHINRDDGNAANASDIYAICGLDKLPDGSKIAIFVDNSGSMTTNTVRAAYDDLIAKLQARNMDVITVTNSNEDWITPFDQILN